MSESAQATAPTDMLTRLEPLIDSRDLTVWESGFLRRMVQARDAGQVTALTPRQLKVLADLHRKHF